MRKLGCPVDHHAHAAVVSAALAGGHHAEAIAAFNAMRRQGLPTPPSLWATMFAGLHAGGRVEECHHAWQALQKATSTRLPLQLYTQVRDRASGQGNGRRSPLSAYTTHTCTSLAVLNPRHPPPSPPSSRTLLQIICMFAEQGNLDDMQLARDRLRERRADGRHAPEPPALAAMLRAYASAVGEGAGPEYEGFLKEVLGEAQASVAAAEEEGEGASVAALKTAIAAAQETLAPTKGGSKAKRGGQAGQRWVAPSTAGSWDEGAELMEELEAAKGGRGGRGRKQPELK